jgi:hypothetical protein
MKKMMTLKARLGEASAALARLTGPDAPYHFRRPDKTMNFALRRRKGDDPYAFALTGRKGSGADGGAGAAGAAGDAGSAGRGGRAGSNGLSAAAQAAANAKDGTGSSDNAEGGGSNAGGANDGKDTDAFDWNSVPAHLRMKKIGRPSYWTDSSISKPPNLKGVASDVFGPEVIGEEYRGKCC